LNRHSAQPIEEVPLKIYRIAFTGILALFGTLTAFHPSSLQAQTNADITHEAFETTVTTNAVTNFTYTSVAIPAGKRLVIQNVSVTGAAESTSGPIQPITIILATLNGSSSTGTNLHYFAPPQNNQLSTQYYGTYQTTIYADSLAVGPAFAGFSPTFDTFNVVITGYLVDGPPATPAPTASDSH
jgi:hypothetical protein